MMGFGRHKGLARRPWRLSAKLLIASSVATVIGFSAICASVMVDMRRGEEELARQTLENLASGIDADINRNVAATLKLCGPAILTQDKFAERTTSILASIITRSHPCQQDLGDDDDAPQEEESSEYDWLVIDTALDVVIGLSNALGDQFSELWKIFQKPISGITPGALALLQGYEWPGNVRELENVIQSAIICADAEVIRASDLPERLQEPTIVDDTEVSEVGSFEMLLYDYKVRLATKAVQDCKGNKTLAARSLNISRAYLHRLIRSREEPEFEIVNPQETKIRAASAGSACRPSRTDVA